MKTVNEKELKLIDKASSEFAGKKLAKAIEASGTEKFSPEYNDVVKKAYELDFFHMTLPESAGGSDSGLRAFCRVLENISMEDSSLATIILTTVSALDILIDSGNEPLVNELINDKETTDDFLLAHPVFSNPVETSVDVKAEKNGTGFLLSGGLDYLVLAGLAKKALIPAKLENDSEFSYFLVELASPEITLSEQVKALGITACPVCDASFNKAKAQICCKPEDGKNFFEKINSKFSVALAAMQAGLMKGALRDALSYAANRQQGGRAILHWSEVKKVLSGMAMNIQLTDMLVQQCCTAHEEKRKTFNADSAAAFLKICEMACDVTSDGIRVMGGVGYMKDFDQEKRFRDARHLMSVFGMMQTKKLGFLENHITKSAAYTIQERA